MCPLRIILIFLSATLAGFFVLRNLKSDPTSQYPSDDETHEILDESAKTQSPNSMTSPFSKVCSAMESGFWTCVDMASGRYLWRHLGSSVFTYKLQTQKVHRRQEGYSCLETFTPLGGDFMAYQDLFPGNHVISDTCKGLLVIDD